MDLGKVVERELVGLRKNVYQSKCDCLEKCILLYVYVYALGGKYRSAQRIMFKALSISILEMCGLEKNFQTQGISDGSEFLLRTKSRYNVGTVSPVG